MSEEAPDCLGCGACCFSDLPTYVRVTGDDYARLGERAEALTVFVGHRCYMRLEAGHCAALRPSVTGFPCSVYEDRPETCRTLGRGSPECEGERATKGDRPARALRVLRAERA
jgi:Fe-S-cluster containining protein